MTLNFNQKVNSVYFRQTQTCTTIVQHQRHEKMHTSFVCIHFSFCSKQQPLRCQWFFLLLCSVFVVVVVFPYNLVSQKDYLKKKIIPHRKEIIAIGMRYPQSFYTSQQFLGQNSSCCALHKTSLTAPQANKGCLDRAKLAQEAQKIYSNLFHSLFGETRKVCCLKSLIQSPWKNRAGHMVVMHIFLEKRAGQLPKLEQFQSYIAT